MPAFCHQGHLRMGEGPAGRSIRTPTRWALPTLTKESTDYFLARPQFAQSVTAPAAGITGRPSGAPGPPSRSARRYRPYFRWHR
jgi:hypothetical protein